ncbi:MAG: NUDIX domain-containing protein [Myxococcales bacterium]|nr:NUDIX domain-containing protein [Myxococcales bacterium]
MPKTSAGLLCYRHVDERLEVLVVHPGGPFFVGREEGVWTLPKGELDPGEEPLEAAFREFGEETGFDPPDRATLLELGTIRQKSGKIVHGYAARHDVDPTTLVSGTFELEWPRKSGRIEHFPEVDRAAWLTPERAAALLNPAQVDFVTRLQELLHASNDP